MFKVEVYFKNFDDAHNFVAAMRFDDDPITYNVHGVSDVEEN